MHFKNGEDNPSSKLNREDILCIRALYNGGEMSHRRLGIMYNVSHTTVGRILRNENWTHVQEERGINLMIRYIIAGFKRFSWVLANMRLGGV